MVWLTNPDRRITWVRLLFLAIRLYVTVIWSGAASTAGLGFDDGTVTTATALTTATGVAGGTLGLISATPGADAGRVGNWDNTGTNAKRIRLLSGNTGNGVLMCKDQRRLL